MANLLRVLLVGCGAALSSGDSGGIGTGAAVVAASSKNASSADLSVSDYMQHMLSQVVGQQQEDVVSMRAVQDTCTQQEASYEGRLAAFNKQLDSIELQMATQQQSLRSLQPVSELDAQLAKARETVEGLRSALARAKALFDVSKQQEVKFNKTVTELATQLQAHWNKFQDKDEDSVGSSEAVTRSSATTVAPSSPITKIVHSTEAPPSSTTSAAKKIAVPPLHAGAKVVRGSNASTLFAEDAQAGAPLNSSNSSIPTGPERLALDDASVLAEPNISTSSFLELRHVSRSKRHRHEKNQSPVGTASNKGVGGPASFVVQPPPRIVTPTIVSNGAAMVSSVPTSIVYDISGEHKIASGVSGGIPTQESGANIVGVGTVNVVSPATAVSVSSALSTTSQLSCVSSCMPTCNSRCLNVVQTSPPRSVTAVQSTACAQTCMPSCEPTCHAIHAVSVRAQQPNKSATVVISNGIAPPSLPAPHLANAVLLTSPVVAKPATAAVSAVSAVSAVPLMDAAAQPVANCASTCMPACTSECIVQVHSVPATAVVGVVSHPTVSNEIAKVNPSVSVVGSAVISGPAVVTLGGAPGSTATIHTQQQLSSTAASGTSLTRVAQVAPTAPVGAVQHVALVSGQPVSVGQSAPLRSQTVSASAPRFKEAKVVVHEPSQGSIHSEPIIGAAEQTGAFVNIDHRQLAHQTRSTREGSVTMLATDAQQAQQLTQSSMAGLSSQSGEGTRDQGSASGFVADAASASQMQRQSGVLVHAQHREVTETSTAGESQQVTSLFGHTRQIGSTSTDRSIIQDAPTQGDNTLQSQLAGQGPVNDESPVVGHALLSSEPLPSQNAKGASLDLYLKPGNVTRGLSLRTALGRLVNHMDSLADEAADTTDESLQRVSYTNVGNEPQQFTNSCNRH